ncbi:FxsA family protein [Oceanobacillus jeddahense]|uniref:FxsA family protein n=1 Tax=Oceanobacillus jeddahense TaxID=1462527 RepID=A0ABY5JN35_9BACI|nr:FxsA family protein [Oceanobacillus jeddahense]UUI01715.1 FxsA family protein [Oceanobacillus jeddahense]
MSKKYLLLAFIIIPAIEIGVFLWLSQLIGVLWVVGLIIATAMLGIFLARYQGMEVFRRAQLQLQKGFPPTEELLDGMATMLGAFLLIIPGFVLDAVGLLLLIPWTRNLFKRYLKKIAMQFKGRNTIIYRRW